MNFKVVDIPQDLSTGASAPVIEALKENVGRALEVDIADKNANTVRKNLRSGLVARKILLAHNFHTKISTDGKTLTVWLSAK